MNYGDVYLYNKDDSKYGKKGDRYVILHPHAQMKIGSEWEPAVVYAPAGDRARVFCRETARFQQNFVKAK